MYPDYYTYIPNSLPSIHLADTAHIKPPYVHFRRQSADYILYFILSGTLYLREGNARYTLVPGDYLLLDPHFEHEGLQTSICSFTYIHFSFPEGNMQSLCPCFLSKEEIPSHLFAKDTDTSSFLFPKYGIWNNTSFTNQLTTILERFMENYHQGSYFQTYSQTILCEILELLSLNYIEQLYHHAMKEKPIDKTISDVKEFLTLHFSETLHSSTFVEKYHCNFDYLNRQFKKKTGQTIFSCLNEIRIEQAKKYLATGLYSCSEVASKTGFHDVYYFSRVFKKLTGITPSAYHLPQ